MIPSLIMEKNLLISIHCNFIFFYLSLIFISSFINRHTNFGSNVLDLTGGTGGCFKACVPLHRSCVYSDIDHNQANYAMELVHSRKYICFSSKKIQ
jgi:hypothetical protein